ncbi:MAG: putative toxin-antitoxin system toxin component, PIN family [Nanoarchaeota archaeon]|nr:putative toxin-antitoxin system toxin component, PIN family [Nanoarchaeota archaeon]
MLRIVADTNTLISAFFWDGNEAELFRKIEQKKVDLFISQEILKEIRDVLNRPKFKEIMIKANTTPDESIQKIISVSHLVIGDKIGINVCRDVKDNKFLECAEHAKADYIVSGDKDLLVLKEYKNIKIIRTFEILEMI